MEPKDTTICVIEDNKPIRKLYCTLLKKSKYKTVEFPDGNSAVEWLKDNRPDGVIVDILLPDQSGVDILNFIRQQPDGASLPVIASTGFANASDRAKYLELGFNHYIPKPVNTATFVDEVKSAIEV